MGTVTNSFLTFEPKALLKSSDLNNLFDYLAYQDEASNLYLDGSGIAYGLNISVKDSQLTISKGFGVSSYGDVVVVEQDMTFNHATLLAIDTKGVFKTTYELSHLKDSKVLTADILKDKCLFIHIANVKEGGTICGVRSDKSNTYYKRKIRFFFGELVTKSDTNGKRPFSIPQIRRLGHLSKGSREINLNAFTDKTTLMAGFKGIFTEGVTNVFQSYAQLITNYPNVVCLTKPQPTEAALLNYFKGTFKNESDLRYQNAYDYLKDVEAAFEELAQCAWFKMNYQMPTKTALPATLALGKVVDDCSTCRQEWQSVQAYDATLQEAIFYAERLRLMLLGTSLDFDKLIINISLTPSKSPLFPLSQRAIPIYFKTTALLAQWNCPRTQTLLTNEIPTAEDNPNKLLYDTEGFDFYHINGHLGRPLKDVLPAIEDKKRQLNVAFDIVPIYFGNSQSANGLNFLDKGIHLGCSLSELEREFGQQKLYTLCILSQYKKGTLTYGESNTELQPLIKLVDDFQSRCLNNFDYQSFMLRHADIFIDTPSPKVEERKLTIPPCLFDYFKVLQQLYITQVEARQFQDFALCHPGLEHANGVLRGGTLVLVYDTKPDSFDKAQSSVFTPTVIADFMLPGCVQWHLPTAAFTMGVDIRLSNSTNIAASNPPTVSLKLTNYAVGAESVAWETTADIEFIDSKDNLVKEELLRNKVIDICGNLTQELNIDIFRKAKTITFEATQTATCGQKSSVYSEELVYTHPVVSPKPTDTSNETILRQRHQSYKTSIDSLEKDTDVKGSKAAKLGRLFVFFPKAQPKLTEDFGEFLKAVNSTVNLKSKQPEQQAAYWQLLETTTYFYFDKLVAESKTLDDNTLNAITNTADFLSQKEQDATAFVTKWQSKDIEIEDNKSLISSIEELFKKA